MNNLSNNLEQPFFKRIIDLNNRTTFLARAYMGAPGKPGTNFSLREAKRLFEVVRLFSTLNAKQLNGEQPFMRLFEVVRVAA